MVTNDIDRLLARYFAGEPSPQDEIELDNWLNESGENEKYFFELTSLYQNIGSTQYPPFDTQDAFDKFKNNLDKRNIYKYKTTKNKSRILLWALSATATIAGLLILFNNEKDYTIITQQSVHKLANNTEVNLTTGEIHLSNDHTNDTIYLVGTANFKMESDKEGSKIVKAGNVYIKDIGTKFTVDANNPDSVYVSVTEGEVQFYSDNSYGINLRVLESGYYLSRTNKFYKTALRGSFNFSATPLNDVANELTDFFGQTIVLEKDSLNDLLINVSFQDEDLETILDVLSVALNIKISYTNHQHVIKSN